MRIWSLVLFLLLSADLPNLQCGIDATYRDAFDFQCPH